MGGGLVGLPVVVVEGLLGKVLRCACVCVCVCVCVFMHLNHAQNGRVSIARRRLDDVVLCVCVCVCACVCVVHT